MDTAVSSERDRLDSDKKGTLERLQQKHAQELEILKQEAERKHKEQVGGWCLLLVLKDCLHLLITDNYC